MSVGLLSTRCLVILLICVSIGCRLEAPSDSGSSKRFAEITLFDTNADATNVVPSGSIRIDMSQPLEKRLKILADAIYGSGWFKVVKIEDTDQGKKATIEMIDPEPAPSHLPMYTPWFARFQGSTGGYLTGKKINQTFWQVIGQPEWVEAIHLTYDGTLGEHADDFVTSMDRETLAMEQEEIL